MPGRDAPRAALFFAGDLDLRSELAKTGRQHPDGWALTACTETTTRWTDDPAEVTCRNCLRTHAFAEVAP